MSLRGRLVICIQVYSIIYVNDELYKVDGEREINIFAKGYEYFTVNLWGSQCIPVHVLFITGA